MHQYFQLAEYTSELMRNGSADRFIYTTHPWLMQRFLECPCPDTNASNKPVNALGGVWNGGSTIYFVSSINSTNAVMSCLTSDIKATAPTGCTWEQATCTLAGNTATCKTDAGTVLTASLSGDMLTFPGGVTWNRYTGSVSGLW
jgi:hypothetical protein